MDTRTTAESGRAAAPDTSWSRRHRGAVIVGSVLAVLVLATVLFLLLFDWDWLRGPIGRYASARTGREVRIEGHLKVHPWSLTPRAEVQGLRIGNPSWVGSGQLAYVRQFDVSLKLPPLLVGRVELPLVRLEQPQVDLVRDAQDRANWRLTPESSSRPAKLPPIQRFIITNGGLTMKDAKRDLTLTGTINAAEQADGSGRGFRLIGQGVMNKEPFKVEATGGPLIHVEASKPYPFHLDVHAGRTRVEADGQLPKPFNLGELQAEVQASGPNLADLFPLIGITLPATPPYTIKTHVDREGSKFTLAGINGRVGESDLEGSATLDKPKDRREIVADLSSRRLVFADLLAVIGGGPKVAPKGMVKADAAPSATPAGRLLPDAPLYKDRLRTMDAKLKYNAQSVVTTRWPLRKVAMDLTLDHGLLTLDPIDFDFPKGKLAGKVRIDGRKDVVVSDLDMRVTGLTLQELLPPKAGQPPAIEGVLQARAQLHGRGDSIHQAASNADGRVVIVSPSGKIRQAFAELMGINVANGLYLLLSKDNRETDLRCAVAAFDVKNGVMTVNDAVFDTGVVRAEGKGSVDLKNETVDLRLDGQSKEPRILRLWAPITLKGTLLHPKPGVDAGKAVGQVGIAAAIGAVLTPLAAILPFIEPGLAKDANCSALIQEAKAEGAPVKAIPEPPPSKKSRK